MKDELALTWSEISDILNKELNQNLNESTYRKKFKKLYENESIYEVGEDDLEVEIEQQLYTLQKERIKIRDEITQLNGLVRLDAREEFMREAAVEAAKSAASVSKLESPKIIKGKDSDKAGLVLLGDWHYGIDIDVYYNKYNPDIARERVQALLNKITTIINKEKINQVIVVNLGDMISGRIHLPLRVNSRLDTVSQTMEVSELLSDFLNRLSNEVKVKYVSVLDNHARVEPKKKESLQTESFARIIDWFLKERLKENKNIKFLENKYGDDIATFKLFDYKIAAIHGDKDYNRQIRNLNMFTQTHHDLILSAHMHHFSADEENETVKLCNGSLMGCDDYSSDLRLNSLPSQLFVVSSKDNLLESIHKIDLKEK